MKRLLKRLKILPKAKLMKLAYAFVGMIVSGAILIAATTSMAWFSQNKRVDARELEIKTLQGGISAEYRVYKWKYEEGALLEGMGTNLADDGTTPLTLNSSFKLNTHDVVFTSENLYTAAIVRIELSDESNQYTGKAGTIRLTLTRDPSKDTGANQGGTLSDTITSVATFSCANQAVTYGGANDPDPTDADEVYQAARDFFCNAEGKLKTGDGNFSTQSFATYTTTVTNGTPHYSDFEKDENTVDLVFSVSYTAGSWQGNKLYAYFCIMYDDILAEEVVASGSSNYLTYIDLGNLKEIKNDLSMITVDFISS
ncbi:MAG: hypothetical protein II955_00575 [Clostridia bacterium]|nr:hypothetical protein [Clostridia bacterium]